MSQIEDLVNNIFSVFDRYVGCFYSGDRIFLCRDNNGVLDFKEFLIATHQTVRLFVHEQQKLAGLLYYHQSVPGDISDESNLTLPSSVRTPTRLD